MKRSDFYYDLPEELIAQTPAEKRDMSRLMAVSYTHLYNGVFSWCGCVGVFPPEDAENRPFALGNRNYCCRTWRCCVLRTSAGERPISDYTDNFEFPVFHAL